MKVLILAGGYGTRLSEETEARPKPMVEIGGRPILWHIMKIYSHFGFHEFIVLLGYKGYVIKEYFANYFLHKSDVTIDLATNKMEVHDNSCEPWKVSLIDTGLDTMTGGRLLRVRKLLGENPFMLTYGDGVADIAIDKLLAFHHSHGKTVTMTTIQPEGRFGALEFQENGCVSQFCEKPKGEGGWINGGFFVCTSKVFDYLADEDRTVFERSPLERLSQDGELYAYRHTGFWRCMDTLRDKVLLNRMWQSNQAKWKLWK